MRQRGKASLLTIVFIAAVLVVVGLLAFSKESLTSIGGRFMDALQHGDVKTLTSMSYLGKESSDEMAKQWDFSVNRAGKYYIFLYRITSTRQTDPNTASVTLQVTRDALRSGSYEEKFELPLVKVDNDWKVDVRAISREMYPGLPR